MQLFKMKNDIYIENVILDTRKKTKTKRIDFNFVDISILYLARDVIKNISLIVEIKNQSLLKHLLHKLILQNPLLTSRGI